MLWICNQGPARSQCQVCPRPPRSRRPTWYSPHAVRSCCRGGSTLQRSSNWHASSSLARQQGNALLLLTMLLFSERRHLRQQRKSALCYVLCFISGESGFILWQFFFFSFFFFRRTDRSFVKKHQRNLSEPAGYRQPDAAPCFRDEVCVQSRCRSEAETWCQVRFGGAGKAGKAGWHLRGWWCELKRRPTR